MSIVCSILTASLMMLPSPSVLVIPAILPCHGGLLYYYWPPRANGPLLGRIAHPVLSFLSAFYLAGQFVGEETAENREREGERIPDAPTFDRIMVKREDGIIIFAGSLTYRSTELAHMYVVWVCVRACVRRWSYRESLRQF